MPVLTLSSMMFSSFCLFSFQRGLVLIIFKVTISNEPRHEKTNVLHMRKQRRRSASR